MNAALNDGRPPAPRWIEAWFYVADDEARPVAVRGHVRGAFGLCRSPAGFWCPVHLPTRLGICPGTEFPTLARGQAFCEALIPLVEDWTMLIRDEALVLRERIRFGLRAAAAANGAVYPLYAESFLKIPTIGAIP